MGLMMLIPKTFMDFNENCYPVVNSSTVTDLGGGVTSIENTYTEYCNTKDVNTPNLFFIWYMRLMWVIGIWAFIYFLYEMLYNKLMRGFEKLGWLKR